MDISYMDIYGYIIYCIPIDWYIVDRYTSRWVYSIWYIHIYPYMIYPYMDILYTYRLWTYHIWIYRRYCIPIDYGYIHIWIYSRSAYRYVQLSLHLSTYMFAYMLNSFAFTLYTAFNKAKANESTLYTEFTLYTREFVCLRLVECLCLYLVRCPCEGKRIQQGV